MAPRPFSSVKSNKELFMPESTNISLMELAGRFLAGGVDCILQRYPEDKHFLVIPPNGSKPPSLLWTSQARTLAGTTDLLGNNRQELLSFYADPSAVITPLCKKGRNTAKEVIVGRSNDCDIRFKAAEVSKKHAAMQIGNLKATVQDLGSTNGTKLNGHKILMDSIYELSSGQELSFGDTRAVYINLEDLVDLVKLVA
jgi:hypothetical protein